MIYPRVSATICYFPSHSLITASSGLFAQGSGEKPTIRTFVFTVGPPAGSREGSREGGAREETSTPPFEGKKGKEKQQKKKKGVRREREGGW